MTQNMLRIETSGNVAKSPDGPVVLFLNGQLVAETLPSLMQSVANAIAEGKKIELDLDGVVRADLAAAQYLTRIRKKGVRLRQCPLTLRVWLTIAMSGMRNGKGMP